jgi:outer membrane protein assembly factor BamB
MRLCASILAILVLAASASRAEDWPQWRGPNRDGKSAETGLLKSWPKDGPKLLWAVEGLGTGWSSPAVVKGLVFVTGVRDDREFLYAYDLDGKLVWKEEIGPAWTRNYPGSRHTPAVSDGDVYVLTGKGLLSCYEAKSGGKWWRIDLVEQFKAAPPTWGFAEGLLVDGDNLICTPGGKEASLVALMKKSGQTTWTSKGLGDAAAYTAPILVAQGAARLIVQITSQHVVGVDAATGRCLWRQPFRNLYGDHCVTPIYQDGRIYAVAGFGLGGVMLRLAPDGKSVTPEWTDARLDSLHGGVILVDGFLYGAGDRNPRWLCLDWKTGEVKYEARAFKPGGIAYAEGMLYCYSQDGIVALVPATPREFQPVASFAVPKGTGEHWAHPVISGGRLYIRHGDVLMAYDIQDKSRPPAPPGAENRPPRP